MDAGVPRGADSQAPICQTDPSHAPFQSFCHGDPTPHGGTRMTTCWLGPTSTSHPMWPHSLEPGSIASTWTTT